MVTSYIGSQFAEGDSVAMPSHQAGDLLVGFCSRIGSTNAPSIPAGWSPLIVVSLSSRILVVAFKLAQSDAETSGTWTNATVLGIGCWRHSTNYLLPGDVKSSVSVSSTNIVYPAVLERSPSWKIGLSQVPSNTLPAENPPAGMTFRGGIAHTSLQNELALHDTNGDLPWASNVNVAMGASTFYTSAVIEVSDTGFSKASGGSTLIVIED